MKQIEMLKKTKSAYGGSLLKTRKGRAHGRPLSTRDSMHLVLRSTKAKGEWSFRRQENYIKVDQLLKRFANKHAIKVLSYANVGNHLHLQIRLSKRQSYRPFIRGFTAALTMAITGASRWNKLGTKFWDRRPFTRIVKSWRAVLNLRDYIFVNQLEGIGYDRQQARFTVAWEKRARENIVRENRVREKQAWENDLEAETSVGDWPQADSRKVRIQPSENRARTNHTQANHARQTSFE
jgi:hypothetical protein